jgi:hypothetical protein
VAVHNHRPVIVGQVDHALVESAALASDSGHEEQERRTEQCLKFDVFDFHKFADFIRLIKLYTVHFGGCRVA